MLVPLYQERQRPHDDFVREFGDGFGEYLLKWEGAVQQYVGGGGADGVARPYMLIV